MIIRLLPTYMYLFIEAQNAQPFSLECTKVKLLKLDNFEIYYIYIFFFNMHLKLNHHISAIEISKPRF